MKKTTFVYGDFNILHPGHLRLLKFAKESGGYLVVGVFSNRLAYNKTVDEDERLENIQSTSYVDEAFILDTSPLEYIKTHKPSIVVKGKEFESEVNEELEILKSYGGKLIFSSGAIGFASQNIILNEYETSFLDIKHDKDFIKRHSIDFKRLEELVESFKRLKVFVVGDTIVDEYITCDAIGMSQEDPTIVVTPIASRVFLGGAAIVAAHAKSLGADVVYASVLGDDEKFVFVKDRLGSLGIETLLLKDNTRPTTLKQRFRSQNKTLLRVNHLKAHQISKDIEDEILSKLDSGFDLIIFSDFSYGVLSKRVIDKITLFAKENSIYMVADSQSSSQVGDIAKFKDMTLVTPTEREIRLSLNDFESGLVVLSKKLHKKSSSKYIFTTLGGEGVMIYNSNQDELLTDNIKALNTNAKDISGAGDSLLTCSSMALVVGANIWESGYLGSIAAAIQVSRVGNEPIKKDDILREVALL